MISGHSEARAEEHRPRRHGQPASMRPRRSPPGYRLQPGRGHRGRRARVAAACVASSQEGPEGRACLVLCWNRPQAAHRAWPFGLRRWTREAKLPRNGPGLFSDKGSEITLWAAVRAQAHVPTPDLNVFWKKSLNPEPASPPSHYDAVGQGRGMGCGSEDRRALQKGLSQQKRRLRDSRATWTTPAAAS